MENICEVQLSNFKGTLSLKPEKWVLLGIVFYPVKWYNVPVSVYSARLNSLARRLAAWARLYNRLPELPWNYRPFHQLLMTWLDSRLMIGWNSASIDQFDHWFWDFLGAQLPFSVNIWNLIRNFGTVMIPKWLMDSASIDYLIISSENYLCPIGVNSLNTSLLQMLSLFKMHLRYVVVP